MIQEKIWTKPFIALCLSNFFLSLNIYMLNTVFPLYVKESLGGNQQQMGLVITMFVIGVVMIRLFSGQWADRFGNKKMAVIGLGLFLLAILSYWGTSGILIFLVIRYLHGTSYAIASTALGASASSLIPSTRQGAGLGYFSMFMSIAMVIGPACGLYFWKDNDISLILMVVCFVSALSLLFTMGIPKSKRILPATDSHAAPQKQNKSLNWRRFIEPNALPISVVAFFLAVSYSTLGGFIPSFTSEIHQSQVAGTFFVAFAIMIVFLRPAVGRLFDHHNEHYLFYPGIILFAAGMILLSQASTGAMILIAGVMMGSGYGALFSCLQTIAIVLSPEHRRGSANGTFFLLFDLGIGVGSYFMGLIAAFTDYRMMFTVAGGVALLSAGLYYALHHRTRMKLSSES